MKARLLFVLFVLSGFVAAAQEKTTTDGTIDFEWGHAGFRLWRDTATNPNCIWQIGRPQKTNFTVAHSPQRAFVTDTLDPYPVNDTSSFYILQHAFSGWDWPQVTDFDGWYFVDSDTLTDYGKMELSPDNGATWIDLLTDTTYRVFQQNTYNSYGIRPILTGSSGGWKHFRMNFYYVAQAFNVQYMDTILMRFTFISDGVQTNRDGLMFDDLEFRDIAISIPPTSTSLPSTPSPNPATSTIHFTLSSKENDTWRINLYTLHGQKVKSEVIEKGRDAQLSVEELPPSTYYYTITGMKTGQTFAGSVIIAR